jgi:hypothetical protein
VHKWRSTSSQFPSEIKDHNQRYKSAIITRIETKHNNEFREKNTAHIILSQVDIGSIGCHNA